MKRPLPLLLSLLLSSIIFAQSSLNQILDSYENYFELPRETLFVHTNKTAYLPGETIWFNTYLYNRAENVPYATNTNLLCALFNEKGEKIEDILVNVINGTGSGHMELPKSIEGERIFLKARTQWMKNFKEDDSFTAPLKLVGAYTKPIAQSQSGIPEVQNNIALMPEGGHLLANTVNTVGLKLLDLPDSDFKSLRLFSKDGTVLVQSIQTNEDGIGKFEFIPLSDQEYYVGGKGENGEKMLTKLGKAEPQGITLSVNNLFDDKVAILLKTNEQTLENIKGKDHFVAIHRDGILILNAFQFNDSEHSILVSKDKLLKGMNIITVFDHDLNPILERLIFNETNLNTTKASVSKIANFGKKDSVGLKINLFSKTQAKARLSVSVLPEETESMSLEQSILSAFLIQPYVKSPLRNAAKYLRNLDRTKKYELDNMLLTLGWGRYDWSDIFGYPPTERFAVGNGFQLAGKVMNAEPEKDKFLAIYQKSHPQMYQAEIDNNKDFKVDNMVLHKGEEVYATLLNGRNKTEEPKITVEITPSYKDSDLVLSALFLNALPMDTIGNEEEESLQSSQYFLVNDRTIALDEVTVTEEKIEKKLVHKPAAISYSIFEGLKITEEEVKKRPTLQLVLQNLGYQIVISPLGEGIILPKPGAKGPGGARPPVVIVDDIQVFNPSRNIFNLPHDLLTSDTAGIDEIYYTHQPIEMGQRPVIYIYRKYGSAVGEKPEERFASFVATQGFQRPKEFYNPQYASVTSERFKSYGTLHWENQLNVDESGEAEFVVPTLKQEGAKVYVEGVADDGTLISEYQTVSFE
ncbi:hypothetical protein GTQ34_09435 [Muricauda sp. JGD-17]|uniref:MG2 domain-containing protein n=1 Tax=Flagellimonas ochracea TaxID=2696472 RepID=A0A964WXH6_9FLAO|nr:hypothetical protein [Allomuricauda ochracea]NAY92141.1 hypothetical protein [Allomuricauda ochracea]